MPHEPEPISGQDREHEPLPPDPVIEVYRRDVDLSLVRVNLRLTPEERLRKLQQHLRFAEELRRAGRVLGDDRL